LANPYRVNSEIELQIPRVVAALQPWARISQRLRRKYRKPTTAKKTKIYLACKK